MTATLTNQLKTTTPVAGATASTATSAVPALLIDGVSKRFVVGRRDPDAPQQSVGLGLPRALAIAQAHGGTIEVRSRPGEGSTFTLAVPVAGPPQGAAV